MITNRITKVLRQSRLANQSVATATRTISTFTPHKSSSSRQKPVFTPHPAIRFAYNSNLYNNNLPLLPFSVRTFSTSRNQVFGKNKLVNVSRKHDVVARRNFAGAKKPEGMKSQNEIVVASKR